MLRNAKFEIRARGRVRAELKQDLQWLLQATRRQGPDTLTLLIAVEGEKFNDGRARQIMGDNRIKVSRSKESGRITVSVLGTVPREHAASAARLTGCIRPSGIGSGSCRRREGDHVKQQKLDRAPAARCYRCGSTEILSLCHHCARPMCEEHSPLAFREGVKRVAHPTTRRREQ